MKKIISVIVYILFALNVYSNPLIVQGVVHYNGSDINLPVPNHELYFMLDTDSSYISVYTDQFGRYQVILEPMADTINLLHFSSVDCRDSLGDINWSIMPLDQGKEELHLSFEICSSNEVPCEAYYDYQMLSDREFQFYEACEGNLIWWHWDFADGNSSTKKNPKHFYYVPGVYNVVLTVITDQHTQCRYSDTIVVERENILAGEAFVKDEPLNSGEIFTYQNDFVGYVDFSENSDRIFLDSGRFLIPFYNDVQMLVKVVPDFHDDDRHFPEYFPTYNRSAFYWGDAKFVYPHSKDSVQINLLKRDYIFYGNGSIEGRVNFNVYPYIDPQKICVLLLDESAKKPLKYTFLNSDYTFALNNLPTDGETNYNLLFDAIGVDAAPMPISIDRNHAHHKIEFYFGEYIYTSIKVERNTPRFNVFPNPFVNELNVEFVNNPKSGIQIIDALGKTVFSKMVQPNKKNYSLNLNELSEGFYMVKSGTSTIQIQKK